MNVIVQYTTPTIEITFPTINTANITEAYLSFKCGPTVVLSKNLTAATVAEKKLSWRLSQQDTSTLALGSIVKVCCDWKLNDGTRGRSKFAEYIIAETGKSEVI